MITKEFTPNVAVAVNPYNSYSSVGIVDIEYRIEDYVLWGVSPAYITRKVRVYNSWGGYSETNEEETLPNKERLVHKSKVRYENTEEGRAYFKVCKEKVYLDECVRI